jgi:site-specific DNA-cytosine methylase
MPRLMDLCSGAGGLSSGLEAAGVATACWAIESCEDAAQAFQLNHPDAEVSGDTLKGLSHEMDLAFENMYCKF